MSNRYSDYDDEQEETFKPASTYIPEDDYYTDDEEEFHSSRKHRSIPDIDPKALPWKVISIAAVILIAVILMVVFQDEITQFLQVLLTWIITVAIVVLIVVAMFKSIFGSKK